MQTIIVSGTPTVVAALGLNPFTLPIVMAQESADMGRRRRRRSSSRRHR